MKIYHGTSANVLESILKSGIRPRCAGDSQWSVESGNHRVYLTTAYAPYFAINAAKKQDTDCAVLIEVELRELPDVLLGPDEDWLEQAARWSDLTDLGWGQELADLGDDMKARTYWFRDHIELFQHLWPMSLQDLGTVAFMGTVPVNAITRVSTFNINDNPEAVFAALDPSITIANYKLMADKYHALTEWFFGAPIDEEWADRILGYAARLPLESSRIEHVMKAYGNRKVTVTSCPVRAG